MSKHTKHYTMGFAVTAPVTKASPSSSDRAVVASPKTVEPVSIDSDYPTSESLAAMREVIAPKLKKLTKSLF